MPSWTSVLWWIIPVLLVAGGMALTVWWLWRIARGGISRATSNDTSRKVPNVQTTFRTAATPTLLIGFALTFLGWYSTHQDSQRNYLAEQFARGFQLLQSKDVYVRVAGVYMLDEVTQRDLDKRVPVLDVLEEYIRQSDGRGRDSEHPVAADTQAALTVISKVRGDTSMKWLDFTGLNFTRANLRAAKFAGARLMATKFVDADLYSGILFMTELYGADLHYARMAGANLADAYLCEGWGLPAADFTSANLTSALFYGARAQGVKFAGAKLANAKFSGVHLEGADFSEADAWEADFQNAHLSGAKFVRTRIGKANFSGSDLADVLWDGVIDEEKAIFCRTRFRDGRVRNDDC